VVVEVADERGDGALEIDVVFPQGIVGIDEQRLARRKLGHGDYVSETEWANRGGLWIPELAAKDNKTAGPPSYLEDSAKMYSNS